jgi:hypothetical protein
MREELEVLLVKVVLKPALNLSKNMATKKVGSQPGTPLASDKSASPSGQAKEQPLNSDEENDDFI